MKKLFRISKTNLQIRPIYHRLSNRIDNHICISFVAYSIYKELKRILKKEKSNISLNRAAELTHNMYRINVVLPESNAEKSILLRMSEEQKELLVCVEKNS